MIAGHSSLRGQAVNVNRAPGSLPARPDAGDGPPARAARRFSMVPILTKPFMPAHLGRTDNVERLA
jgi:hypothetical protein